MCVCVSPCKFHDWITSKRLEILGWNFVWWLILMIYSWNERIEKIGPPQPPYPPTNHMRLANFHNFHPILMKLGRVGRGRMGQAGKMGHFKWLLSMTSRVNIFWNQCPPVTAPKWGSHTWKDRCCSCCSSSCSAGYLRFKKKLLEIHDQNF